MKPKRNVTPYIASSDDNINASITLLKVHKRIRTINSMYKPTSRYQARIKSERAARRASLHIVR